MKQSRMTSLLKSLVSTAVGFGVAYVANMLILPLFGLPISHSANLILTIIYTVISIARGYVLERVFERMGWRVKMSPFASAVLYERQEQKNREGWDDAHDDSHAPGELARAGAAYALWDSGFARGTIRDHIWIWSDEWFKPDAQRKNLARAAALLLAEGDKFDRSRKSSRLKQQPVMTDDRVNARSPVMNPNNNLALGKTRSEHSGTSG